MDATTEPSDSTPVTSVRSAIEQEELRTILSNLSQEISRPLVSLRAGFDLILGSTSKPISSDQRGHVQAMAVLCDDLLRLTRSYMEYAGLLQGANPLSFGTFTVGALIREVDRQFSQDASARGVTWESTVEGDEASVTTDASRCQQIFGNIAANALKYTPAGGEVRLHAKHEGRTWLVTISDNGPGIPNDSLSRVFEPFFRLTRDERAGIEGSGLGLAICRELVDQLGGEITIASNLGEGTRISVRLPSAGQVIARGAASSHPFVQRN